MFGRRGAAKGAAQCGREHSELVDRADKLDQR